MKKNQVPSDDLDMLPEYDFTNAVRVKYAARYAQGTNLILLAPDVAKQFPDSDAVNSALRRLIKGKQRAAPKHRLNRGVHANAPAAARRSKKLSSAHR